MPKDDRYVSDYEIELSGNEELHAAFRKWEIELRRDPGRCAYLLLMKELELERMSWNPDTKELVEL